MMDKEFIAMLKAEVAKAGGQKALAKNLRISPQYINDVLRGRRDPGDKILKPLGLKRVVSYERRKP